jgi:hypothetical protein
MKYSEMTQRQLIEGQERYNNLHNEGAEGYNPFTDELDRRVIEKKYTKTEWTRELTIQRREEWNKFAKSFRVMDAEVKALIMKKQAEQGWWMSDLKKAIKKHGL